MGDTPLQTSGPAQAPIFESRPPQPASRGESQSSIQPSLAISVPASTPSTTPQVPSATSSFAKPVTLTAATAAAHNWPSLDSDTYFDTECGPFARNTIEDSGQDGAYTDGGGKGSGTHTDARTSSVSATDTIADAYRKPD